jgi:hypothetical protein
MSSSVLPLLQVQLTLYGSYIILIFGNIGNAFIVILFSRHRQNSCSTYLLCAAFINSVFITFNISLSMYTINYGDPTIHSLVFCKLRLYFIHVWSQIAKYLIVLSCVDRFVLTNNNAHFRAINRRIATRCIIGIVIIFWHIVPIHSPILATIMNGRCGQFGVYYIVYYTYLLIFVCFIPSVSMTIFSALAHYNIKRLHARVQPIGNTTESSHGNITIHRRDRELFIMVLAEVAVYIVTTSVYPFILLEVAVTTYIGISKSPHQLQIESFISAIGTLLIYVNSAAPFYTYFAVSGAFRKECNKLFSKWRRQVTG